MRSPSRSILLAAAVGAAALVPQTAVAAQATVARSVVAGPSADISTGSIPGSDQVDVDVASDGTAAIAYRQLDGGQPHVFVSERKADGTWTAGARVDTGLATPSSAPRVAVGTGGHVIVLFPNGPANNAALYAAIQTATGAAFGSPQQISPSGGVGWNSVDVDIADNGSGYFAGTRGFDLLADRVEGSTFTPLDSGNPLQVDPTQQVGAGTQFGPHLAVDPTGASGTMAWPEPDPNVLGARIPYARKLTGLTVGPGVSLQAASLYGHPGDENANDDLNVAIGGGTTWVAWHASFDVGCGLSRAHGVVRSFDGTNVGPLQRIDGISDGPGQTPDNNAEFPRLAVNAAGQGLGGTYLGLDPFGAQGSVLTGTTWGLGSNVTTSPETAAASAFPAVDASGVGAITVYNTTSFGHSQIVGRVYGGLADGSTQTLSDPTFGNAESPISAKAGNGKSITAFLQGTAATTRLVATVTDLPVATPTPTPTPTPIPTGCPTSGCVGVKAPPPVAPILTGLTFRTKSFARGTSAPSIVTATSSKRALSFTLNKAATATLTISRATTGRSAAGTCVTLTKKNRSKKSCTRYVLQKGKALLKVPAGTTNLSFQGTLTRGKLAATGKYQLSVKADDGAGGTSAPSTATYTLTAAKKPAKKK